MQMIRTRIIGTGSYLPERVVSNREVGASLGIEPAIVARLTGIQERRRAAASQASSDLAVKAARPALEAAGLPVSELGAIVLSTTSPDSVFPSTACHVQRMLGCSTIPAFDVAASCSGFLYGLSMADAMIEMLPGEWKCEFGSAPMKEIAGRRSCLLVQRLLRVSRL